MVYEVSQMVVAGLGDELGGGWIVLSWWLTIVIWADSHPAPLSVPRTHLNRI